ncbi:MAG: SMI1/KNR4 family protein [Synechococcales bacterium]|nr:SMI1/KNR4 family protein [Synechococcales bacterium]
MNNYLNRFTSMLDEIRSQAKINIKTYCFYPPFSKAQIAEIERDFDVVFHESISNFYQQIGGFRLEWISSDEVEDEAFRVSGSIHLIPIEQVLSGWENDEWFNNLWFDWMDESQKKDLKRLKPFDYFNNDDSGCTCFRLKDKTLDRNLQLHSVDYGTHQLDFGFEVYLEKLLKTRGFYGWQFLLAKDRESLFNYEDLYAFFHSQIPQLFPNTDFSEFE